MSGVRVGVSIGGSVFIDENGPSPTYARQVGRVISDASKTAKLVVVVGGGSTARKYIAAARDLGSEEATLDDLGIDVTRINARILIAAIPQAYQRPAHTFDEALTALKHQDVVIMGGTHAGHTTDAVAAMAAEKIRADRLVIATNVDAVYDSDPKTNPAAKKLTKLTADELVRITFTMSASAGSAGVVDPLAARLIARSRIPTGIVNGKNLEALSNAILGKDFPGSLVEPAKR
jgi:uridylate kinase